MWPPDGPDTDWSKVVYIVGVNCATMIGQTGISLEAKCGLLIGLGLDAECGPLIG